MAEKLTGTVGTVWNIAQPLAEELGLILWTSASKKRVQSGIFAYSSINRTAA